ncbi:hypothetical protein V1522DRAFT_441145 [Lipomyces starkeyi]
MSAPAVAFSLFPLLPPELRRAIWKQCLPRRVVEIDAPRNDNCLIHSRAIPSLLECVASREKWAVLSEDDGDPSNDDGSPSTFFSPRWFSPATDIVHLNWDGPFDVSVDDSCNPIPFFLWKAAKGIAASITVDLLGGFKSTFLLAEVKVYFDLLERRKDYVVTLHIVNLHCSFDQAASSGLFGTLVEERVKLIDATDEETILNISSFGLQGHNKTSSPRHSLIRPIDETLSRSDSELERRDGNKMAAE